MIGDPIRCPCGKKFFPFKTRTDICRDCARKLRPPRRYRRKNAAPPLQAFDEEIIDDETEGVPSYVPTQDEIAAECAAIRLEWSRLRWREQEGRGVPLTIPEVTVQRAE